MPDLQLLAGVDDWHLSYDIICPFYDLFLLPRGMCPTFSFWQGLMSGILVTISVALFMIYFSHVICADLQFLAGVDDWHLSYVISCPFYDLLLPRGMCPTFSFWLGARTLGFCNGMCYQLWPDLQLLAEVRGQLSFCNGAGARVFAWLSLLRFVWAYFMGFSFAHIHFQYLLFPVMPLLVY